MIEEGKPAPTFTLTSDSGDDVSLESLRGKPVVLYFYPRDDSRASISSNRFTAPPAWWTTQHIACVHPSMGTSQARSLTAAKFRPSLD